MRSGNNTQMPPQGAGRMVPIATRNELRTVLRPTFWLASWFSFKRFAPNSRNHYCLQRAATWSSLDFTPRRHYIGINLASLLQSLCIHISQQSSFELQLLFWPSFVDYVCCGEKIIVLIYVAVQLVGGIHMTDMKEMTHNYIWARWKTLHPV